jgi:hypothetical protein
MSDSFNLWATNAGSRANEDHTYTATTEELITLAAHWHEEAEGVFVDAVFYEMGISGSDSGKECYAYERRNRILELLDKGTAAEAIARGEHILRTGWGLTEKEWQVFCHGPDAERDKVIARVREKVNRPCVLNRILRDLQAERSSRIPTPKRPDDAMPPTLGS